MYRFHRFLFVIFFHIRFSFFILLFTTVLFSLSWRYPLLCYFSLYSTGRYISLVILFSCAYIFFLVPSNHFINFVFLHSLSTSVPHRSLFPMLLLNVSHSYFSSSPNTSVLLPFLRTESRSLRYTIFPLRCKSPDWLSSPLSSLFLFPDLPGLQMLRQREKLDFYWETWFLLFLLWQIRNRES